MTPTTTTLGSAAGLELGVIVATLLLLLAQEYAGAGTHPAMRRAARRLLVGVIPLLIASAALMAIRLSQFFD